MSLRMPIPAGFFCLMCFMASDLAAQSDAIKVAVLDDSPPMAYRDANGGLTGFSNVLVKALCEEMKVTCEFHVTRLDFVVDDLMNGGVDMAAVGLLNTPDRRRKILFSSPFYRSVTLWYARPGVDPDQPGVRVSTFRGSAQERYAKARGWNTVSAKTDLQMIEQLSAGVTQGMLAPLMTSLNLQKNPQFLRLGLMPTAMKVSELEGDACFGINPQRPEIKSSLDAALETLRRNGTYDRINSQFLPFRVD